jgi:RNA polymerase sigma-70 factor (ECF subfamily)
MNGNFDAEVLPHLTFLQRRAVSLVRDQAAAEDLVQDALLQACRFWHRYRPNTNIRAWLATILRHCFINEYRKSRRGPVLTQLDEATWVGGDRGSQAVEAEAGTGRLTDATVITALEELPPKYRQALLLSDLQGLSLSEISRRLGIPVGTAKSRIFRGRRAARARLRGHALAMGYVTSSQLASGRAPDRRVA